MPPPPGTAYEIFGDDGDDLLSGGSAADILHGDAGSDTLNAGNGNDTLHGGAGADVLNGGDGIDAATYEQSTAAVTVNLRSGTASGGDAQSDTFRGIENLIGSRFDDKLSGDAGNNVILGGGGGDKLFGDDGHDRLEGGNGADTVDGGNGNDIAMYAGSRSGVAIDLASGKGNGGDAEGDVLRNVENVSGSRFNDVLMGNAASNILDGGDGDDLLEGRLGRDTIAGGSGNDSVSYAGADRAVSVDIGLGLASYDANVYYQPDIVDLLSSIENAIGGDWDDVLLGSSDANILDGGAGADTVEGYDGNDTVIGGAGNDSLDGGHDDDIIQGGEGADELRGDDGNDVLEGGAGHDELLGGADIDTASYASSNAGVGVFLEINQGFGGHAQGDTWHSIENVEGSAHGDVIVGNTADNEIRGGGGDDVLRGAGGDDVLFGGAGHDTFWFDAADYGIDVIVDFVAGGTEDAIDLTDAGTEYGSLDDILANAETITGTTGVSGLLIDLGPAGFAVLLGVEAGSLTSSDFIF